MNRLNTADSEDRNAPEAASGTATGPEGACDGESHEPVRMSLPGFADIFAAAQELPLDKLHGDHAWCASQLQNTVLEVIAE